MAAEPFGYSATRHQREVGVGYFDAVAQTISAACSTTAMGASTETAQFLQQKMELESSNGEDDDVIQQSLAISS
jgi:hypothetical protein